MLNIFNKYELSALTQNEVSAPHTVLVPIPNTGFLFSAFKGIIIEIINS